MDPKPGHVVVIDDASVDDTTELGRLVPGALRHRARLSPARDEHRAAPAVSARPCASRTSSARRGCGSWTTTSRSFPTASPAWALAPRFKSIQGRSLRLRRQRVLLAVPGRRAARHPDPVRARRIRRVRLQAHELGMLRGHVHPPRHRPADRPARPAVLHLLGRPDVRLARLTDHHIGHRERVRAAAHARDQAVGHGHPPHERLEQRVPVLHHAQSRSHEELLPLRSAYQPSCSAQGRVLTFAKELVRLLAVERHRPRDVDLFRGSETAARSRDDASWKPMPPLATPAKSAPEPTV